MKKVKFMLLSLALVAVVGAALAFKAKDNDHFCSTLARVVSGVATCKDAAGAILKCPNYTSRETVGGNTGAFYCTTPDISGACPNPVCGLPPVQTIFTGN